MSPLPENSPLVKAAHAGYAMSTPAMGAGMFTPVGNAVGVGAGGNGGMGMVGAPIRPGKGKGPIRA